MRLYSRFSSLTPACRALIPPPARRVYRPGERCFSGATAAAQDSTDTYRPSRARFALLGASATLATAASGYLLYESLYIPGSVRAAIAEIRRLRGNKAVVEIIGDNIKYRSDWSVEERGDDALVRVNASGIKAGGMFTCYLSRIEGSWKVVTLDVIYHEPRKETKLESQAVYDELEKALAK